MTIKKGCCYFLKFFILISIFSCSNEIKKDKRVLLFSKTIGYRHKSIENGKKMFQELALQYNFKVDTTEDARYFLDDSLKNYSAIVFLSNTGDVLDFSQRVALKRYVEAGGGVMGIHGASGAENSWPWFRKLMGTRFESHPEELQKGEINIVDSDDETVSGLPNPWHFNEEWYNFDSISLDLNVLAFVNEDSYKGGKHGKNHPIFWKQEFDGGRSFYTALGHRPEAYEDSLFRKHIINGLDFIIGENLQLDYKKSSTIPSPNPSQFVRNVLLDSVYVTEPMELAVAKDGSVFYVERKGLVKKYNPKSKSAIVVGQIPVFYKYEDGLLGLTLDPKFENNNWIYVMYSAPGDIYEYHISRFTLGKNDLIDMKSEKILLKVPQDHSESNHTGGSLAFDKDNNLFISIGDNTNPFGNSNGFAPIDERSDRTTFDAQRSSGNTDDLRGKILRIHPEADGPYSIPKGNLFPEGSKLGKPEIYVMGTRNSFRISVDQANSWLYWGDVGPDAGKDSVQGPKGYDEINLAKNAGNFGWPFFVGNNRAYTKVNYSTGEIGEEFNPKIPINDAPRNTGSKILPPAQPALIYYPYEKTEIFPWVGEGGRTAMAGPTYHYNPNLKSSVKLPKYFDKALFIYDWMRNWIMVIRLDEQGKYVGMEPFMPTTQFVKIIDMEIGSDGALYILEYGENWYSPNRSARLSRLEYQEKVVEKKETVNDKQIVTKLERGHEMSLMEEPTGLALIEKSDCKGCHTRDQKSVGPSFLEIAEKYSNDPEIVSLLSKKVINGGGGVWGQNPMSAHPQLKSGDVNEMVKYILSLK